jgi:hypothetical protein
MKVAIAAAGTGEYQPLQALSHPPNIRGAQDVTDGGNVACPGSPARSSGQPFPVKATSGFEPLYEALQASA